MASDYEPGDAWQNHYRGYRLHANADGEVWWQVYQGTDRLYLEPTPDRLVESLLDQKRLGGRVRITENNDVLTCREDGDGDEVVWVGDVPLEGEFVPADAPEYGIPLQPDDVESGDLWPSVYDGAKYSFAPSVERVWWTNPSTHKRHPVRTQLPTAVTGELGRRKPQGGSFRVTPWNDVLTLVDLDNLSPAAKAQFDELPRVVKNIIKLRKERGVEKLPVYVGHVERTPFKIDEPPSLTDPVSADDLGVDDWTKSLGSTTQTDPANHRTKEPASEPSSDDTDEAEDVDIPVDDPIDW